MKKNRRKFIKNSLKLLPLTFFPLESFSHLKKKNKLKIALQVYSFASQIVQRKFDILDFPDLLRNTYNISGAEYWSIGFLGKENENNYLLDLKKKSDDLGIDNLIILVDNIDLLTMENGPSLASSNKNDRDNAINFHKKWIDIAKKIDCHSIRINLRSEEDADINKILDNSSESILKLIEYSKNDNVSIVVENHGGITGDADWLVSLMKNINSQYIGTLPDFGDYNFCIKRGSLDFGNLTNNCENQYDKYEGVKKLMPYAKGVSAKSHEFDNSGEELYTDFSKMMKIIKNSSYEGYITVEYEGAMMNMFGGKGNYLNPDEGVKATQHLIKKHI